MSEMEAEISESPLAIKILDYFRRHPRAKDSVEGIAKWWVDDDPVAVRNALDSLVEQELVERRENAFIELFSLKDY